jgi:GNAT superfamily N-acetyltransferase
MRLSKASKKDFDEIYSELERSFPSEERRDEPDALAVMDDPSYAVYFALDGEVRVGLITVWEVSEYLFVEHFAVYEKYRNRGYGKDILELLKSIGKPIFLEVEPPLDEMKKRRIGFYQRSGFKQNSFDYVQPPYRPTDKVTPLIIMSYPCEISDAGPIIKELYRKVYGIK